MKDRKRTRVFERWGQLRHAIIGHLLASPPKKGDLKTELARLAAIDWKHPTTGEPTRFAAPTIERWYYKARRKDDPVTALSTKQRSDAGSRTILTLAQQQFLIALYNAHKDWSVKLFYQNLESQLEMHPEFDELPHPAAVRRFLQRRGMFREPKLTHRDTAGAEAANNRKETFEVRSYEVTHVGGLYHWDAHVGSCSILTRSGEWRYPVLICVIDDHSRLACHAQWYWAENGENVVHALTQAFMKRGLPRSGMSDNGGAMIVAEVSEGLGRLGITHERTLPYSPYQNGKQEAFWRRIEGELIPMARTVKDLSLSHLNYFTQLWIERDYNHELHTEIGCAPSKRFNTGPDVLRPSPDADALKLAFTRAELRTLRRSDGTVTISGQRFEVPNRYRHMKEVEVRYAKWDLSFVHLVDPETGAGLDRLYPLDKAANASGVRRALEPPSRKPMAISYEGLAPRLKLLHLKSKDLPPTYLSKDEDK